MTYGEQKYANNTRKRVCRLLRNSNISLFQLVRYLRNDLSYSKEKGEMHYFALSCGLISPVTAYSKKYQLTLTGLYVAGRRCAPLV